MTMKIRYTKTGRWVFGILIAMAAIVVAAPPNFISKWTNVGDFTVTAASATCEDSLIVATGDIAVVHMTASGTAVFDRAGESLTIGIGNTYADHNSSNLESCTYTNPRGTTGTYKMPFITRWIYQTGGANTDTLYFQASGYSPGGAGTNVGIEDLIITSMMGDE